MTLSSLPDPIYEQIERGLARWAQNRADVLAILVIGSRARVEHPADALSDLDTIIFVEDPAVFSKAGEWQGGLEAAFGLRTWFAAFGWTLGDPEWEYVLEDARKVDLVFTANRATLTAAAEDWQLPALGAEVWKMADASPYRFVFERGARVLYARSTPQPSRNDYAQINSQRSAAPTPPAPPDQAAFNDRIANTLLELVRAAKIARRGELYRAARILNTELQDNLLALVELHAQARHLPGAGLWGYGRFLEEWADPRAVQMLPDTHAQPTARSVNRAVLAGIALLKWLGPETAAALGLLFPEGMLGPTLEWMRGFLE